MTVVKAAQIEDSESILAWLSTVHMDFQRSWASVLSSRCALRVMPLLGRRGKLSVENHFLAMKYGFWRNILSRSFRKFPDRAGSVGEHFMGLKAKDAEVAPTIYSAYSAASNANGVMLAVGNHLSIETAKFAALNSTAAIHDAVDPSLRSDELYQNIRLDAEFLEDGGKVAVLQNNPLWSNNPNWWKDEIFDWIIQFGDPSYTEASWGIWLQWYDSLAMGKSAFGLTDFEAANDLERAIALGGRDDKFNEKFWTREPGEINREIAQWVAEARAAEVVGSAGNAAVEIEIPAQSIDATMFGLDQDGKIARIAVPPEQRLLITTQQQKEYKALREDALELSARGQVLGQVGAEIGGLLASLPIDMSHASVFDVWRALNRLRRTMNAHQRVAELTEPHDAKLEPAIAEELFALLRTANIFAFGDPGLLRRDEKAIAPQDKPALQIEKVLGDGVAEAAVKMPELFTEDALGSVVAEESNAADAGDDAHGQQAIDQTNKTRRNWIAAMLSGLKAERGFAWKEMRSGAYKKTGEAGFLAVGVAISDVAGLTAIYPAIWNFVSNNGTSLLSYVKTVYQNPALSEFVAWVLKGVGL